MVGLKKMNRLNLASKEAFLQSVKGVRGYNNWDSRNDGLNYFFVMHILFHILLSDIIQRFAMIINNIIIV